jgi:hypothetical protein
MNLEKPAKGLSNLVMEVMGMQEEIGEERARLIKVKKDVRRM